MFFAALDQLRRGTPGLRVRRHRPHPAHVLALPRRRPSGRARARRRAEHRDAIRELYQHNDALVGQVMARLRDDDVLMVISDHGFSSFRRGVNLNAGCMREGYLALKPGADGAAEWLRDVDWSQTRAYASA